jgi:hypothetical protein
MGDLFASISSLACIGLAAARAIAFTVVNMRRAGSGLLPSAPRQHADVAYFGSLSAIMSSL